MDRFEGLNAQVLGISVDHIPCLEAWAESLGGITYPLISDFWPHGMVARQYGVLRDDGSSERAIFIIDREGIIRFIDIHDIDDQPRNEEIFAILRQIDPENAKKHPFEDETLEAELPHGGIIMYCNTWCPGCRKARAFFETHHLDYKEVDISRNRAAAAQVRKWADGYETTPTFDIDGKILVNYDEAKLSELINEMKNSQD